MNLASCQISQWELIELVLKVFTAKKKKTLAREGHHLAISWRTFDLMATNSVSRSKLRITFIDDCIYGALASARHRRVSR